MDILSAALDHLSLGRAYLVLALSGEAAAVAEGDLAGGLPSSVLRRPPLATASDELDHAVADLRRAGTQHELPRGLLDRAVLRRVMADFDRARHDLDEALSIATRGGMRLHEADCHLETARLFLAMGDAAQAQEHFAVAKRMVAEMGYGRRDREVAELEAALGVSGI
jgi:hypothetical protein